MKKLALIVLLLTFLFAAIFGQQNPSITIVNNTGYTVWYVYISQTASPEWGSDWLAANEILNHGHAVTFNLQYPINVVNRYDIRLVDLDGDSYTKMNVLVTAGARIVFTFDDFD
jgi:hypothetical protein